MHLTDKPLATSTYAYTYIYSTILSWHIADMLLLLWCSICVLRLQHIYDANNYVDVVRGALSPVLRWTEMPARLAKKLKNLFFHSFPVCASRTIAAMYSHMLRCLGIHTHKLTDMQLLCVRAHNYAVALWAFTCSLFALLFAFVIVLIFLKFVVLFLLLLWIFCYR